MRMFSLHDRIIFTAFQSLTKCAISLTEILFPFHVERNSVKSGSWDTENSPRKCQRIDEMIKVRTKKNICKYFLKRVRRNQ